MCEDRISQLPDAILQQILSLIDINEAVETSILSTRWKNLCFSLSDLKFHLSRFAAHRGGSLRRYEAAEDFSDRFSDFVSHFLSHRDAATTIRSFHLSFGSSLVSPHRAFLEEVYLHIYKGMKIEKGVHLKCVRMLEQLGNAKIVALTLTLDTLKILEMDGGVIEQRPCPFPYIKCLKLMKGRREIRMVLQSVMKYLTMGNLNYESLMVEFPADHSVAVVDEISEDVCDDHNCDELEYLFD